VPPGSCFSAGWLWFTLIPVFRGRWQEERGEATLLRPEEEFASWHPKAPEFAARQSFHVPQRLQTTSSVLYTRNTCRWNSSCRRAAGGH